MVIHFDNIFPKYQRGSKIGFSSQQWLIVLLEKGRKSRDKGGNFATILKDFSKEFNCLFNDFLIAKLRAYVFDLASLKLIYTYLSGREKKVKINEKFMGEILLEVPQASILGKLLFNIFICDFFLFANDKDVTSYADDNILYATSSKVFWQSFHMVSK